MKLADLHCDATWKAALHQGLPEDANETMISYYPDRRLQAFAIFLPEDCDGEEMFSKQIGIYRDWRDRGLISECTVSGFITLENAGKLPEKYRTADFLRTHHIRFSTLTWNGENDLAGGCMTAVGLKDAGKAFLRELKASNTLPDLSHLSDRGVDDLLTVWDGAVVASHSNCRTVCNHPRNLTDEMIREIFARDGIVGINLHAPFLTKESSCTTEESCRYVLRHIDRFLSLGGEKHLAFGCDFDGGTPILGLNSPQNLEKLYETMVNYLGQSVTDGIFYENAVKFLQRFFR